MFPMLTKDVKYLVDYSDINKYRTFINEKEKSNYISLLKYELEEINRKPIGISAKWLYKNKYEKPNSIIAKRCLDFKDLEKGCRKFEELKKHKELKMQKSI